ncbi:hypothetical protein ACGFZS_09900 [Streptomyces sp. NPDC048288]|uniref:hypothetical protein n=1 Tax=Streptomyces sp. NPDC048288 TaxID=3365529 RepID=UPI003712FA14
MAFPEDPLGARTKIKIGGVWTDVTQYALTRDIITHTRGRTGEGQAVDPASCSLTLRSPNGLFSPQNPRSPYYQLIGRNTPMRVSVQAGQQRLLLPDDAPNARATTPSSTALNIAGNLDARIEVSLVNWQAGTEVELFGKYLLTGNQRSWMFSIGASGLLTVRVSTDGNAVAGYLSTAPVSVPPSGRLALRVTRDNTTGATTFYTAPSISGTWVQLGNSITLPTGAIFASTAPLTVGDIDTLGFTPPDGSVYVAQLRNGINGTVVASVDFTAPAIGATSFVDTTGLTWTLANGAAISNERVRFSGEYSDWPPRWSGGGRLITVEGAGAGILRRLNQGKKPLASTLRRRVPSYSPVAYWPMEEGSDATQAYSPIAGVRPMTASAFEWAADDTLPGSSPLPVLQVGASFVALVPSVAAGTWQVELVYNLDAMPAALTTLFEVRTTGTARRVRARVATNQVLIDGLDADDVSVFSATGTAPQFNGSWARLQIKAVQSGANVQYVARWIVIGGSGFAVSTTVAASPGYVLDVRSSFGTGLDGMRWGHLAVFNSETDAPFNSADQAFNGETAGTRLRRLSVEESLPITVTGVIADQARMGPQRPATLLEQVEQCEAADGGILVEDRERLGLRYRSRTSQLNQTPALTLSYGQRGLAALEPSPDDVDVRNDITVTRIGGSSGRAELLTGPMSVQDPPDGIGRYDDAVDLNLYRDYQAEPMAWWLVYQGTWDEARYPTVTILLHRAPELIPAILDLSEGDLIRITDLPDFLPPGPLDLLVQGYSEQLRPRAWRIDLVCVPAGPYQVGVVEDSVAGRVDANPGGSLLAVSATAVDTQLVVHTPAAGASYLPVPFITSSGPVPTYAAEFPFDVRVAGEVIRVTGCVPALWDQFARTVSNGWGTPDIGGSWALTGTAADFSVGSGVGSVAQPSTGVAHLTLTPAVSADVDLYVDVAASVLAAGASLFTGPLLRAVDNNNHYAARVEFTTAAGVLLTIRKRVAGTETQLGTFTSTLTHTAGTFYRVRFQAAGTTLRAKIWAVGPEPAQWQITVTDSSLTAAANVGTRSFANTGSTAVSPVMRFDNLLILTPQLMTVQRSVNGVPKAQAAGAEVRLQRAAVVAL